MAVVRGKGRYERFEVLVTVKASPQPSKGYGETVCVAGIRLEHGEPLELIRLYPVPFRLMDGTHQFEKFQIIHVDVERNPQDNRTESYRINADSVERGRVIKGWPHRLPYVNPFIVDDVCSVIAATRGNSAAPSLAVVRPVEVLDLVVSRNDGWTPAQQRILDQHSAQLGLFDDERPMVKALQAPRFLAKYHYRCGARGCNTHTQGILDWELTALQRRLGHLDDADAAGEIRKKFLDMMTGPARLPAFFVGNQHDPQRRGTFSVLSTYYPNALEASMLF